MPVYYINTNKDSKGYNEVHKHGCSWLTKAYSKVKLGEFSNATAAVNYAKRIGWKDADGCYFCCPEAHNG